MSQKCELCDDTGVIKRGFMKGWMCSCMHDKMRKHKAEINELKKKLEEKDAEIEVLVDTANMWKDKASASERRAFDLERKLNILPEEGLELPDSLDVAKRLYEEGRNPTGKNWLGHTYFRKPPWEADNE